MKTLLRIPGMGPRNKVPSNAYSCCGAWVLGDALALIANLQPALTGPLIRGNIFAVVVGQRGRFIQANEKTGPGAISALPILARGYRQPL
ncbi:ethanolamine utilization protein EutH [Pseudomonas sessilinigenes]|uniref:Ethanolamine utilization protein EutH n=1 Tax=Pseudomonas sessilinigenes TaxID=658629 RepID=A0ABX8MXL5_9PSED|nr:ethanolamine utilization protein EutH [Pseudomonas sessilinigenes]QXH43078.1 ethanolamine utilization protein EutH [Pseudomonas sessilinigenes]